MASAKASASDKYSLASWIRKSSRSELAKLISGILGVFKTLTIGGHPETPSL